MQPAIGSETSSAAEDWIERLARAGYAAKAVVYLTIGMLAVAAATGPGGQTTDAQGALRHVFGQPFGTVLLAIVALGLAGYSLWRFVQGIRDPEGFGSDLEGWTHRAYALASGGIHAALVVAAVRMMAGRGGDGRSAEGSATLVMDGFGGRWLVALVGAAILGAAASEAWRAWTGSYRDKLRLGELGPELERWVYRVSRLGVVARAVVFAIVGGFLLAAAWQADPSEAKGVGEALRTLETQPYGPWLLGVVALGLIAYGIYQLVEARYRRITPLPEA